MVHLPAISALQVPAVFATLGHPLSEVFCTLSGVSITFRVKLVCCCSSNSEADVPQQDSKQFSCMTCTFFRLFLDDLTFIIGVFFHCIFCWLLYIGKFFISTLIVQPVTPLNIVSSSSVGSLIFYRYKILLSGKDDHIVTYFWFILLKIFHIYLIC